MKNHGKGFQPDVRNKML